MIFVCDVANNKQSFGGSKRFRNIPYRRLFILGIFVLVLCWTLYLPPRNQDALVTFSEEHLISPFHSTSEKYETLTWVVVVKDDKDGNSEVVADSISKELGLLNLGRVGKLSGHFLLAHPWHEHGLVWPGFNFNKNETNNEKHWHKQLKTIKKWSKIKSTVNEKLSSHPSVSQFEQQNAVKRVKRYQDVFSRRSRRKSESSLLYHDSVSFNDPLFEKQWHLKNEQIIHHDMNVTGVWLRNVTGRGVTVAVIDDGLDWRSPDIVSNYNPEGSMDIVSNDDDPSPSNLKETNHHGTRCAGEIAATANNSFCGVGVAFGARVSGIRLIEGPMTDEAEARAFSEKLSINDIYSCSWGPEDDGKTLDGPHKLAQKALRLGTDYGRRGYGSIYVVASGNGGRNGDNCNYDGYANSVYTVTIGAVDEFGSMPSYSEECASMLAVAYSSGSSYARAVVTTDWTMYGGTGCTEHHTGTSAAAPLASGIVALMLEAQPCLTWRDVQYLIVVTAIKVDVDGSTWTKNGVGLQHSHQHGFGVMDAWRLVNAAKIWKSVPWMTSFSTEVNTTELEIRSGQKVVCEVKVTEGDLENVGLNSLEYVHLILTLTHEFRGQVEVQIVCPSGTSSILGAMRHLDDSKDGLKEWLFSTVRCWGEGGHGLWTVLVIDHGDFNISRVRGHVLKWRLQLYGSSLTSQDIRDRISSSMDASSGEFLNSTFQVKCEPPPVRTEVGKTMPEKYLKVLIISGFFLMVMAVGDLVEYSFCYQEEKKEQTRLIELVLLARSLVFGRSKGTEEAIRSNPSTKVCDDADRGVVSENDPPGATDRSLVELEVENGCRPSRVVDGNSLQWNHDDDDEEEDEGDDRNKLLNEPSDPADRSPQNHSRSNGFDGVPEGKQASISWKNPHTF